MQDKKRIVIVTNFFPPVKYIGSNRMEAFAEYLSSDFELTVIAEHPKLKENTFFKQVKVFYFPGNPIMDKLKHSTSDSKMVHFFKTAGNVIVQKLLKSPLSYWRKKAYKKLVDLHNEKPFDIILSSSPYHESHEVAIAFCENNPQVKWICDIRDELSTNPYIQDDPARIQKYKNLEARINQYAFLVSSVSVPLLDNFKISMPRIQHFMEIKNGFNHDMKFGDPSPVISNDSFKIGYFGKFYGIHKPDVFFNAVVELIREKPHLKLDLRFYGTHRNIHIPIEIKELVTFYDHLDYKEAIEEMNKMDLNLLMIPKFNSKGIYTGKIFDYISARKPILGILDPVGVAAHLLERTNSGYIADYEDRSAIKEAINAAIADAKNGIFKVASSSDVQSLHRIEDVNKLKEFLLHNT